MKKLLFAVAVLSTLSACARLPGADRDADWGGATRSLSNGVQNMRQASVPNVPYVNSMDCVTQRQGNQYKTTCN